MCMFRIVVIMGEDLQQMNKKYQKQLLQKWRYDRRNRASIYNIYAKGLSL